MLDALNDETLHDVRLLGTDNVEIACTKFMLASRSPVFKKMFFGEFRERDSDRVSLNYCSTVLKVLVKYCYSDELDLDLILDAESLTDKEAMLLVQLRDAANYFELQEVADHISKEIGESVFHNDEMGCVCAILAELTMRIDDKGAFWDMFLQLAINKAEECLLPKDFPKANNGSMICPPRLLRKILENVDDTFVVVRCLQKWFGEENKEKDEEGKLNKEKQALLDIAKRLDLKRLTPSQLSDIKPCSVFSMEQLYAAFVHHGSIPLTPSSPLPVSPNKCVVYVSGAGVQCLNGSYESPFLVQGKKGAYFVKKGTYGGHGCNFTVQRNKNKWTIFIIPSGGTALSMYQESSCGSSGATEHKQKNIPFTFWKCLDGKAPAPYVAMIDLSSKPPQTPAPFSFGAGPPATPASTNGASTIPGQAPSSNGLNALLFGQQTISTAQAGFSFSARSS
jgi:hypothetical protein